MNSIKGNSFYLLIRILIFLIPILIIGYIINQTNTPSITFYIGVLFIIVFILLIIKSLKDIVIVEFNETNMIITYVIIQKKVYVPYLNLLKWTCIDGQRGHHYNILQFKSDSTSGVSKVKIDRIVSSNKFIRFCKWLKEKNTNLEISIKPSDSKLLYEYYKEFNNNKKH